MSLTSSTQVQDSIIQAVGMIVDSKTSDLGYDKTIQGQINTCVNESLGHYRVRYQDSLIDAYAADTSVKYLKGTSVYVQVPKGDMSQRKTILGAASQTGIQPIQEMIQRNEISDTSGNLLTVVNSKNWPKGVCSNKKDKNNIQKDSVTIINDFNIKNSQIEGYLSNSTHFKISMLVKTNIPYEQRKDGEYGVRITASVVNNATNVEEDRVFQFNNYHFEGAPYSYDDWSKQSLIQDINGIEIKGIKNIEIYAENFPIIDNGNTNNNIFFKQITLTGGTLLQGSEKNGVNLKFNAPQGYTIDEGQVRPIQVQITSRMQKVDPKKQGLNIYWFIRNLNMIPGQPGYLNQGGIGWKRVYPGAKDIIKIKEGDIPSLQRECKYKCVVEYNEKKYEKEFTITDLNHNYVLSITSSEGTYFQYSHGCPTLTCTIINAKDSTAIDYTKYNFVWYMNNNLNQTNYLKDVFRIPGTIDNIEYKKDEVGYQSERDGLSKVFDNDTRLNTLKKQINELKSREYFYQNKFYHINLSKRVIDHSTFVCQVSKDDKILGITSIEIKNKNATSNGYSLVINNGNQSFLYNQSGTALYGDTLENPYEIKPLSFSLFYKGREIDRTQLNQYKYEWKIPASNTLINYSTTSTAKNGYYSIGNIPTINFNVIKPYNVNNSNNDIVLTLNYRDMVLKASTVFSFAKQGGNGTNGTFYQLKVVKVKKNNDKYELDNLDEPTFNFYQDKTVPTSHLFKVLVQKGGEDASAAIFSYWKILTDLDGKDSSLGAIKFESINDTSLVTVSSKESNGDSFNSKTIYHNIIQVEGTPENDNNKTQYFSFGIPTVYYNGWYNNTTDITKNILYKVKLKKGSGFREVIYNNEGTLPSYDQRTPFEIEVFQDKKIVNKVDEKGNVVKELKNHDTKYLYNIANQFTYTWHSTGSSLNKKGSNGLGKSSCIFTPTSTYLEKNCTSNAVYVTVEKGSALIATIHIPIHFMINRYSNPMLNDWDGTSIEIDKDKGYILSPQIGAGHKANEKNDNSFTGIIMGAQQVKQNGKSKIRTGLFGYSSGARSIFLDANTGNATFGTSGAAQIKITATGDSTIQSGDYNGKTKGMKIKFSSTSTDSDTELGPYIKFGSGNFSVSSDGSIHAKGKGDIAGWQIQENPDRLYKGNVGMSSSGLVTKTIGASLPNETASVAFYAGPNNFYVTHSGYLFSKSGQIAGWNISASKLQKEVKETSKNPSSITGINSNSSSSSHAFYAGTSSHNLNFYVNHDGYLFSKNGEIGGWRISDRAFSNNEGTIGIAPKFYQNSTPYAFWVTDKEDHNKIMFSVDHGGNIFATYGEIGNWQIGEGGLYSSGIDTDDSETYTTYVYDPKTKKGIVKTVSSKKTSKKKITRIEKNKPYTYGNTVGGVYIGADGIRYGSYFSVTQGGGMVVTNGTIGGIHIDNEGLSATNWSISGTGKASFTSAYINDSQITASTLSGTTGSSGISGGGVTIGGGGADSSKISPSVTTDGTQTWAKYIEEKIDNAFKAKFTKSNIIAKLKSDNKQIDLSGISGGLKVSNLTVTGTMSAAGMTENGHAVINSDDLTTRLNNYFTKEQVNNKIGSINTSSSSGGGAGANF